VYAFSESYLLFSFKLEVIIVENGAGIATWPKINGMLIGESNGTRPIHFPLEEKSRTMRPAAGMMHKSESASFLNAPCLANTA
jgi:hypothetical protein